MGCLRRLFRLLLLIAIIIVAAVIFLPKFLAQAGNAVLTSSGNPISGVVQLIPANFLDKNNQLQIFLNGLDNSKHYAVTLDPGICGNSGYIDVGLVTSDNSGNVNTTFSLSSIKGNSQGWYVDVHSGASANDSVMACSQLNTNDASLTADATRVTIQLSPDSTTTDLTGSQPSSGTGSNNPRPKGFPQTGVAPGGSNSYDNNVYPRKF